MQELVSIIVPIHNVEEFLPRCIDSVMAQTYSNIELILVDDCSTDNSLQIAQEYAQRYPDKCRVVRRTQNGGSSAARNDGIQNAKGEWFAFIDSDDWITEDYVMNMYLAAQSQNADMVMCGRWHHFPDGRDVQVDALNGLTNNSSQQEIVALSLPGAPSRLIKAKLFAENHIEFPEDIQRGEDIPVVIPLMTWAQRIAIVPKAMYCYYQRQNSRSNGNAKGADVLFYPKTISRMMALSAPGYEKELEFREISELMYGMVTIMLRAKYSRKEILAHIDDFCAAHPGWQDNPYLPRMEGGKRIFVKFAGKRQYAVLKLLIAAWDLKQKLR